MLPDVGENHFSAPVCREKLTAESHSSYAKTQQVTSVVNANSEPMQHFMLMLIFERILERCGHLGLLANVDRPGLSRDLSLRGRGRLFCRGVDIVWPQLRI